ncbi:hypothetical protein [Stomatohabitans albus]|uniref:hypothetical protein n=1 Tax=Stomatohabitans albus TaxID=3110766 RepID=UPI00300D31BB
MADALEELVTLDEPTATAVRTVLRRAGIDSQTELASVDEIRILVVPDQRDRAFMIMANRMEEVLALRDAKPVPKRMGAGVAAYQDNPNPKPLITTRFKDIAFLVTMLLIPGLLTVGVGGVMDPTMMVIIWGLALIIGGVWIASGRSRHARGSE